MQRGARTVKRGAGAIDEAGLIDGVADASLIGFCEDVVVAEDVLVLLLVFDESAEGATTTIGDIRIAVFVFPGIVVAVVAAGGAERGRACLHRLIRDRIADDATAIEQDAER